MLADNIHCLWLSFGCGYDCRIRQQAAFIIGCFTSRGSHKHVPPNSVLTAQMSWFADTALYFSESDRVLQFSHRSYQRSSRVERLCVFFRQVVDCISDQLCTQFLPTCEKGLFFFIFCKEIFTGIKLVLLFRMQL